MSVVPPSPRVRGTVVMLLTAALALILPGMVAAYDWLQFNGDSAHSGANSQETAITAANVHTLQPLFHLALPATTDSALVALSGVSTPGGMEDLVFLTTKDGHLLALDAGTGATVWTKQHGPGTCHINNGVPPCYTTAAPAIDPNRQFIYAYGLDGMVHKHQVGDGTEITTGGWPELATTKPFDEKGSSALSIAMDAHSNTYLYVVSSGYLGDNGDYQGHLTAINLATGVQHVFNTLCSDQAVHFVEQPNTPDCSMAQAGIWSRPGVVYDPATDRIYLTTGNGTFDPLNHDWGDSVVALNPDGTPALNGIPLDSYTPTNFQALQNADADLGSTAPAILPTPAGCGVTQLAVQGGKDGTLRLLNLANLSGQGGRGTRAARSPVASSRWVGRCSASPRSGRRAA